jgi:cell division protein FtsA
MDFRLMRKSLRKGKAGVVAVLDIGTTKTCCIIAQTENLEGFKIIGIGQQVSKGMRAGTIIDMDALETSILNAVHTAEQSSGETIQQVYVNVAGCKPFSQMVDVEALITGSAVDAEDIQSILTQGQISCQKPDQEIIHTLPLSYTIDQNTGIRDPKGMFGDKLIAKIHIIQTPLSPLRNLITCINRCHLDIAGFIISSYASGLGTLVPDEIELGVTLIDIGGGSTDIAVFNGGSLLFADSIPLGGDHVTNDIARGLSTPVVQAERLKTLYGSALFSPADDRELIMVPQVGETDYSEALQISKSTLTRIIQPRIEEIFEFVRIQLESQGVYNIAGRRLVLTGGGSQLYGVKELAGQFLDKHVRLAKPLPLPGLSDSMATPSFATSIGLLQYAKNLPLLERQSSTLNHIWEETWKKFTEWFQYSRSS